MLQASNSEKIPPKVLSLLFTSLKNYLLSFERDKIDRRELTIDNVMIASDTAQTLLMELYRESLDARLK
jgi:hypothetical protein